MQKKVVLPVGEHPALATQWHVYWIGVLSNVRTREIALTHTKNASQTKRTQLNYNH